MILSQMNVPLLGLAGGSPVLWEPLFDRNASNELNVDVSWTGDYAAVIFDISNGKPVYDQVEWEVYLSGDGGANFDSAAGAYRYQTQYFHTTTTGFAGTSTSITISRSGAVVPHGNAANEWNRGRIILASPFDPNTKTQFIGRGGYDDATPSPHSWQLWGQRDTAKRIDALRYKYRSGNVDQVRLVGYGLRMP